MISIRDEAVNQMIKARLNADQRTGGQTIDVYVSDGDILLVGSCDTEEQREAAIMIASGVSGVRRITVKVRVRHVAHSI